MAFRHHELLRLPEVVATTRISRSGIYSRLDKKSKYFDPTFPAPIRLSPFGNGAIAWISEEIAAWLEGQIARRQATSLSRDHSPEKDTGRKSA